MAVDIVGSKMKSQTARGTNNDQTGSFTREKSLPIIPNVAPPNASADAGDWQTRKIDASPITAHDSMRHRGVDDTGSPSGKIGSANVRRSRTDGVGRPVGK
jgi:hypothetical protein